MPNLQLWQLAVTLVSGGAIGAIITALVSSYRHRIQPVGYRIEIVPIFRPTNNPGSLDAKVLLTYNHANWEYENLFIVDLHVVNRGNQDLSEFSFGVTMRSGDEAIHMEATAPDRHHEVADATGVSPLQPNSALDFVVRPFNRGDAYTLKFYVSTRNNAEELGPISLSSPAPVRFIRIPTAAELVQIAARSTLTVGKLTLSIR